MPRFGEGHKVFIKERRLGGTLMEKKGREAPEKRSSFVCVCRGYEDWGKGGHDMAEKDLQAKAVSLWWTWLYVKMWRQCSDWYGQVGPLKNRWRMLWRSSKSRGARSTLVTDLFQPVFYPLGQPKVPRSQNNKSSDHNTMMVTRYSLLLFSSFNLNSS